MNQTRRRYDVAFYVPSIGPLLTSAATAPTGGAETQIFLLARALARRGSRICLLVFDLPGIAIPFFVAHPRLRQLERRMMGDVDGGNSLWRRRLLRHEAGHALDTAYGLRKRADWRRIFGPASSRYPGTYTPQPSSRRHVLHLGHWYAQSHPTEDFAETFAVWLQPKARWRRDYAEWPGAIEKLEFVNTVMDEIAGSAPKVRDRGSIEPLSESDKTLGEHYRRKQRRYGRFRDGSGGQRSWREPVESARIRSDAVAPHGRARHWRTRQ